MVDHPRELYPEAATTQRTGPVISKYNAPSDCVRTAQSTTTSTQHPVGVLAYTMNAEKQTGTLHGRSVLIRKAAISDAYVLDALSTARMYFSHPSHPRPCPRPSVSATNIMIPLSPLTTNRPTERLVGRRSSELTRGPSEQGRGISITVFLLSTITTIVISTTVINHRLSSQSE